MTTRRATVASVVGVLLAGLIAALVNTQALAGGGDRGDALLASPQPAPSSTVPAPAAAAVDSTAATTTVTATAPVVALQTFAAGPAGTVTLDAASGALVLVAVVPAEGWLVSGVMSDGTTQVVVTFTSMSQRLIATAQLGGGTITMSTAAETPVPGSVPEVEASTVPPTAGPTAPGTTVAHPVTTDPRPAATTGATTTTVDHDDDDHVDDHVDDDADDHSGDSSGSGSGDSGEHHDEPDD
jgi:hypothetical protein